MIVTSASYQEHGAITAVIDGMEWSGITPVSRFYQPVIDWEAEGNTIEPYVEPAPTTNHAIVMSKLASDPILKAILLAILKNKLVGNPNMPIEDLAAIIAAEM